MHDSGFEHRTLHLFTLIKWILVTGLLELKKIIEKLYLNGLNRFHGFHQSKLIQHVLSPYSRNDYIYFILFQNHLHELLIIYHTLPCTCEKIEKLQSCMVMKNANMHFFFWCYVRMQTYTYYVKTHLILIGSD